VKTDATLLDVTLHTLLRVVGSCGAKFETLQNGRNNSQQCWELLANNVAAGCLHGALFKQDFVKNKL